MAITRITRRQLLIGAGGTVMAAGAAGLWLGVDRVLDRRFRNAVDRGDVFAPNVFLAVTPEDEVVIWLTKSEMGQGVSTALPMLIADEMDADWSRVRVEQAVSGDQFDYGRMFTAASSSVSSLWIELRRAGAVARSMLVDAAAEQWSVKSKHCIAADGVVTHPPSGRSLRYGALADSARDQFAPVRPRLKSPEEFKLIGQPVHRRDGAEKVDGTATYGIDVSLPGMRRAVVARPPTLGAEVSQIDAAAARQLAGVSEVVKISSGVAVVADTTWSAMQGRDALKIDWNHNQSSQVSDADIDVALTSALDSDSITIMRDDGDAGKALTNPGRTHSAEYRLPFLAHACMEPMNCTAEVSEGLCQIWAPTQSPDGARNLAAEITGLPLQNIRVNVMGMGGGFGRRTALDFVAEAVELANRLEGPVQVLWSREDDLAHAEYREASAHRLEAAFDSDGAVSAWRHRVVTSRQGAYKADQRNGIATMGATDMPYAIPNLQVAWRGARLPVPTRIWRSVGHSYNGFVVESFVDELAAEVQQDPVEFRMALLADRPRLAACLSRVAELAGWPGPGPAGGALGVAVSHCMGSYVAQIAEVAVGEEAAPRILNVWCVADCGIAVNPGIITAQLEGAILYGLDAALFGHVSFSEGAVKARNFDRHRTLRINEAPAIHVELIKSGEPPSGVGEIGTPAIAPAVANALVATGRSRARRLPFTPRPS
jgi:isoquinoline 1-oxidoreductase beta subunit